MFKGMFVGFAPAVLVALATLAPAVAAEPTSSTQSKTTWLSLAAAPAEAPQPSVSGRVESDCVDWWTNPINLGSGFGLSTKDALHWKSPDGKIKIKVGGRVQWDAGWFTGQGAQDNYGLSGVEDNTEFRRIRAYVSGKAYDVFDFKFQVQFLSNHVRFADVYATFKKVPFLGNVRVGHFKEPIILDGLTSSKHITFIERGLPITFSPGRAWGIMAFNHIDERVTWQLGAFKAWTNDNDVRWGASSLGHAAALTGRVTWLPFYEDKGRRLVHLGAAGSLRWPEDPVRFRSRPEAHFVDSRFSDTGSIDTNQVSLLGGEAAFVCGPFHGEAEYIGAAVNGAYGYGDQWLSSTYVQAGYFLTGEHRPYDTKTGVFKGVKPTKNFISGCGLGAWEAAIRYSYLGLDGGNLPVSARDLHGLTVGLNWYLNPNVRISWNYVHSWIDGSDYFEEADLFMMRFQVTF